MLKGLSIMVGVLLIRFWLLVTECYGYHEEKQGTYSYDGTWIPPKKIISKRWKNLQFLIFIMFIIYDFGAEVANER